MLQKKIKKKSTHFGEKIKLRVDAISEMEFVSVLDCYHGDGTIWKTIKETTKKDIYVLGIEKNKSKSAFKVITGDNAKVVPTLDIKKYNVIDLDAYSNPLDLLEYCYPLANPGTVFFYTLIINPLNGGPRQLNIISGQHAKCRSIGNRYIAESWNGYLNSLGVKKYKEYVFRDSAMVKRYGTFAKSN